MRLLPHEGDIDILGEKEELGERLGRNDGEAVGVLELLGKRDGINVGEAIGVLELVGATDGISQGRTRFDTSTSVNSPPRARMPPPDQLL